MASPETPSPHVYDTLYRESIEDPESFWSHAAQNVRWFAPYEKVLDQSQPPFTRWFLGGILNSCYNALDRHVEDGIGDRIALVYDSPVTGTVKRYTFASLLDIVSRVAGGLKELGVAKGDRVVIYLPMVPEAVISMLACARIGAIHSVVFGGFAPEELAKRIRDAHPKVIISASCGIEVNRIIPYKPLLDHAIELSGVQPDHVVIVERPQATASFLPKRDTLWEALLNGPPVPCTPVASTDPLYILYTSGTTGIPKGVVRDNAGHLVALSWSMKNIYGVEPGDVFWAASDVGWVVGHSYIVYAPSSQGVPQYSTKENRSEPRMPVHSGE